MISAMEKRKKWIDIARGFAICFVLFGHTACPYFIKNWIYSFHMPLFFILSGMTLNLNQNPALFIKKIVRSLLVPYLFFSPLLLVFNSIVEWVKNGTPLIIGKSIASILLNWHMSPYAFELWFLVSLFIADALIYALNKFTKEKNTTTVVACILAMILGFIYHRFINFPLPWNLDTVFIATGFIGIGYWIKQCGIIPKLANTNRIVAALFACLALIVNIVTAKINFELSNVRVDMIQNTYGNYIMFIIGALSGTLFVLLVSIAIKKNRILEYLGENSLVYYIVHEPIVYISLSFLVQYLLHIRLDSVEETFGVIPDCFVCLTIVVVEALIITVINHIIVNKIPFIIGKRKAKD